MKSRLRFLDHDTGQPSDCGDVLDIELSSHNLDWNGVIVEQGASPHFYPTHVSTPYFYLALGLEQVLHWEAETADGTSSLVTVPGNIWINPPHTPFTHKIDDPCYFVILAIEQATFLEHCPLALDGKSLRFLNNYNIDDDVLRHMIELFVMEVRHGGRNGAAYLSSLVAALSVHYINNYSDFIDHSQKHRSPSRFGDHELAIVDAMIDEHMDQPITVDDMAEALHCSKFYFLREFKKLTGETPYQHLLNRRLDRARSTLQAGQRDILSIALSVGFNDQSHFTRAFKKRFGKTPGKFRP